MKTVIFFGPTFRKQAVWLTLARYVISDLFRALHGKCRICVACEEMPSFTIQGKRHLKDNFNVEFHEIPTGISQEERIPLLQRICEQLDADVLTNVLAGGTKWGHAASVIAHRMGIKGVPRISGDEITALMLEGAFEPESPRHREMLALQEESFTLAQTVITMSPWEQRRCQAVIEHDKDKVKVCMRGVDLEKLTYRERPPKVLRKFSYIGRNSAEKGYFFVEEAAEKLHELAPDVRLFFAGNFEPLRQGNKVYTGYIDSEKLSSYYDGIDSLLLPSLTEGMPQVVCEAMAKGKPVIVSRHLFQGYLEHGRTAMLVNLSGDDVAKAITMLHRDRDFAAAMGRASREFAMEHFDKAVWDEKYRKIILG